MNTLLTLFATAAILAPGAALATTVSATTDLNVRSGPGPHYPVIGSIAAGGEATINGCLEDSRWCNVTYEGAEGWAYSNYLVATSAEAPVVIAERWAEIGIPVTTYESSADGAAAGAVGGAITGALVAGPVGAAVGAAAGAVGGAVIDPPGEVRTYVTSHAVDPVYLDGEVVVGASLPATVELRPVPDYEYQYVYVNNVPVLVEPQSRRIVYVVR